jgi:hypothetical protein
VRRQVLIVLVDYENGTEIGNPYVTLFSPEHVWVALNSETFRPAHKELINVNDETSYLRFATDERERLFRVVATVGKQDHSLDYESRKYWGRGVTDDGVENAIAQVPLGYVLEDVVEIYFRRTFQYFECIRSKIGPLWSDH